MKEEKKDFMGNEMKMSQNWSKKFSLKVWKKKTGTTELLHLIDFS